MIYFVESPDDDSVRLAMDLRIEESSKGLPVISRSDTTRRRVFEVFEFKTPVRELSRPEPDQVQFTSMSGRLYRLRPLTLRLYNDFVRETVEGQPVFSSDAEVQRFYRESFGWESAHRNPMRG
jgi:hypothetical protein